MNKFIGIGRNTKDGEYRTSESGITIYSNSLAMTNNFKNKDGNYDSEFIDYVAYRNTADYLNKYAKKGSLISLEGRIQTTTSEKDGKKRHFTKIVVESASVLEKIEKQEETKEPEIVNEFSAMNVKTEYEETPEVKLQDEDLPF